MPYCLDELKVREQIVVACDWLCDVAQLKNEMLSTDAINPSDEVKKHFHYYSARANKAWHKSNPVSDNMMEYIDLDLPENNSDAVYVEAFQSIKGDRKLAVEALRSDPLVGDWRSADALLDEMLKANKKYLPRFFDRHACYSLQTKEIPPKCQGITSQKTVSHLVS